VDRPWDLERRERVGHSRSVRRARFLRAALIGLVLMLVLVASGCASDAPLDTLDPQGPEARTIDDLLDPVLIIAGVVFLFVELGIVYLVIRFRRRRDDNDDELPAQTHGNLALELGWTILPAVILAFVAVGTIATLFDLADEPEDALQVTVIGQQWWWEFQYDVDGDGQHDVRTANEMVIPAGEPVNLVITSRDVIHSFWIPALNGKRDAVPGREHPLTIQADEPGSYWGQCTEFCGLSHANMRMRVIALAPDQYQEWVDNQLQPADAPTSADARAGQDLFETTCTTCHQIRGVNDDFERSATVSGSAPDLTHVATRSTFVGSVFRLYAEADEDTIADIYLHLAEEGTFNRVQLEAWLRNPPGEIPMYVEPSRGTELPRGMPDLGLSEQQIDQLVAYLQTLD
jgi:cytochrome c oxidase subunit II